MFAPVAWSADEGLDDVRVPSSWRAVFRNALAVVGVCVAAAGLITAADLHWFRPGAPSWTNTQPDPLPAGLLPDLPVAPVAAGAPHWPTAVAEHLQTPAPAADPGADAAFLTGLQRTGSVIADVPTAIAGGHQTCDYLAEGHTSQDAATVALSHNHTLAPVNAFGYVYSAIAAYCPEYTGR